LLFNLLLSPDLFFLGSFLPSVLGWVGVCDVSLLSWFAVGLCAPWAATH